MEPQNQTNQSMIQDNAKGSVASMVCGIVGIVLSCVPVAGLVLGIIALVLSSKSKKLINGSNGTLGGKGMTIAGLVTGIIAVVFGGFYLIYYLIVVLILGTAGLTGVLGTMF